MRLIKRTIFREELISRSESPLYGEVTASTINIPIFLTQKYDNIGLFTNTEYRTSQNSENFISGLMNQRPIGVNVSDYYHYGGELSGLSSSRLTECQTYGITPYVENFDVDVVEYDDVFGHHITGRTRVIEYDSTGVTRYVFLGDLSDSNFGSPSQENGLYYEDDLTLPKREIVNDNGTITKIPITKFYCYNEGCNEYNTSLSAITKLEEFIGMVFPSEIQSDVFIERGVNKIIEPHIILGEIKTVDDFSEYLNGYYKVNKQIM